METQAAELEAQIEAAENTDTQRAIVDIINTTGEGSQLRQQIAAAAPTSNGISMGVVTPIATTPSMYTATASCSNAAANCWIAVPNPTGTIPASSRASITAIVSPQGLGPGVYTGNIGISITSANGSISTANAPITVIVNGPSPMLRLSETGLQFQAVSGATTAQSQFVQVTNTGTRNMSFSAAGSTLSGGNWLTATPASGSVPATASTPVTIQANPSGLGPGEYFGTVVITATGAVNSPQSIDVALSIPGQSSVPVLISPTSLTFVAPTSGNPAAQSIEVLNRGAGTLTASAKITSSNGNGWFSVTPSAGTVTSAQPLIETIAINAAGLTPGVYTGTVDIHLAETNSDYVATVALILPKTGSATSGAPCTPTLLVPIFTNLQGGFQVPAGIPVPVQVSVTDDCGVPLESGSVLMYLPGSRDSAVYLRPLSAGQWTGTWMPHELGGGPATVGVLAGSFTSSMHGSASIAGAVSANAFIPLIAGGGVVSAASLAENAPLAPGSYISIFGANLATGSTTNSLPLTTTLGGTQVLLAGEALPLQFAASGQINAVIPYNVSLNSVQQLVVKQNGIISLPELVVIAAAQPAVFTLDQSGKGAGAAQVVKADGTVFLNTASNPASAGDALVIYCTGLGAVTPSVAAGTAAPSSPLSYTTNPVTVTIGGQPAQVLFSGLTPGYVGLYQVNVVVPSGVGSGAAVPVVVSAAGLSSPPVTVAIQ